MWWRKKGSMFNAKHKNRVPSQRQLRVAEELKKVISTFLYKITQHNSILCNAMLSISEARVTSDLKSATMFYTYCNGDKEQIDKELKLICPQVKQLIAKEMRIKYIPEIVFVYDTHSEKAFKIESLIKSIKVANDQ